MFDALIGARQHADFWLLVLGATGPDKPHRCRTFERNCGAARHAIRIGHRRTARNPPAGTPAGKLPMAPSEDHGGIVSRSRDREPSPRRPCRCRCADGHAAATRRHIRIPSPRCESPGPPCHCGTLDSSQRSRSFQHGTSISRLPRFRHPEPSRRPPPELATMAPASSSAE